MLLFRAFVVYSMVPISRVPMMFTATFSAGLTVPGGCSVINKAAVGFLYSRRKRLPNCGELFKGTDQKCI